MFQKQWHFLCLLLFNCFISYQNIYFLFQRNLVIVCKCFCVHLGNFWLTKQLNHKKKQPEDLTERLYLSTLLPTEQLTTTNNYKNCLNHTQRTKNTNKISLNSFEIRKRKFNDLSDKNAYFMIESKMKLLLIWKWILPIS